MPTYEYLCSAGHRFEQFQRMSEPPVAECPQCGAPAERQLSAGAGILFKGSGFYITDYRSDSYRKAAEADKGGAPAEKSGGDKSTGEKPAPAAEPARPKDGGSGSSGGKAAE